MHGSQIADLRLVVERAGRRIPDLGALRRCCPEASSDVEVVDRCKRAVNRRRLALEHRLQMSAIVPHRAIPPVGRVQWIAVELGAREPGEVLPHLGGIRAPRLLGKRRGREGAYVGAEHARDGLWQLRRCSPAPRRLSRARVL